MSAPDLPIDLDFLDRVADAAWTMTEDWPQRIMDIGTGDEVLSKRRMALRAENHGNIYIHEWFRSDPDDLHDHPWDFCSVVLRVGYWEVTPAGRLWRPPGSIRFGKAEDLHRIEIEAGEDFVERHYGMRPQSLFITGPVRREWGFHTKDGFVTGRDYRSVAAFRARRGDVR